ncbi:MAG TPA: hypothetical protein VGS80_18590 [Ktedonobacterales bacterium]|nr:hypothetical protein [Ktedonobacterales bacterium]
MSDDEQTNDEQVARLITDAEQQVRLAKQWGRLMGAVEREQFVGPIHGAHYAGERIMGNPLVDYFENDMRPKALDALRRGYPAERERVRALQAARDADSARVERLLASRPGWQKERGIVDVAALREQEAAAWRAEAAQQTVRTAQQEAGRAERWRERVRLHPYPYDARGNPRYDRPYDPETVPDWFEYQ